jgi:hypothetical protein
MVGRLMRLTNVTTGEIEWVEGGVVGVTVPDSSVAVLNFDWDDLVAGIL